MNFGNEIEDSINFNSFIPYNSFHLIEDIVIPKKQEKNNEFQ